MSFKVFIVGDPGVGKTSMMLRFIDDTFLEDTAPTSGGQPGKKRQIEVDGKNERFGNITCSLYQGMHGFIIAYDVNNTETFKAVDNWLTKLNYMETMTFLSTLPSVMHNFRSYINIAIEMLEDMASE
ncbi:Ras subfamily protein [Acanthamoeba castellanii str. Neff]|uniref:Ras subfamily protein n=1 Tax=Acanthamoeba castellanii (strain ATCC 30010 / Neff) TaxID=1257118 RepID=L8H8S8_ACACF|nr:Ras subfamily protein [Acanthamoeba castellanii str. Neff]ELR21575.1 Ras subfamily protein [Acanthamoeba castellanii str. Neff]